MIRAAGGQLKDKEEDNGMQANGKKSGFTLVELMVVAVIVAILAAVAIPLMSGNRNRAIATEAESGLGTIRTALRTMFAQTGAYNEDLNGAAIAAGGVAGVVPGIRAGDLLGRYFDDSDYSITAIGATTYALRCGGNSAASTAPVKAQANGIVLTMDQAGTVTRAGL